MSRAVPITFRIFREGNLVREEAISKSPIKIGKLSSSHLRLEDDGVSRMHAVIDVTVHGEVSIIDLGSAKGTFVNDQKINKARLQSGDRIALGSTTVEVIIGEEVSEQDAPTLMNQIAAPQATGVRASTQPPSRPAVRNPTAPTVTTSPPLRAPTNSPGASQTQQASRLGSVSSPAAHPVSRPVASAVSAPAVAVIRSVPSSGQSSNYGGGSVGSNLLIDDPSGAQIVEVAAMLGDSMVGVKHSLQTTGGKTTPATKGFFGLGAFLVLAAVITFFTAVGTAEKNKHDRESYVADDRNIANRWRPEKVPVFKDGVVFGGGALGLFLLILATGRYKKEQVDPVFRIGTEPQVDFATIYAPSPSFPLVAVENGGFVVNLTGDMTGEMTREDGSTVALSDLSSQGVGRPSTTAQGAIAATIPPKSRVRAVLGNNTFFVTAQTKPNRYPLPFFRITDPKFLYTLSSVAGVFALLFAIIWWQNPSLGSTGDSDIETTALIDRIEKKPLENPEIEEEPDQPEADDDSGGTGTAAALESGKMGKKDSTRDKGRYKMKQVDENPALAKMKAIEQARTAGIVGALAASPQMFQSLTGLSDYSSGFDDESIQGGLQGDEYGEMAGGYGMGVDGFGPGGGGTGWGTIGTGSYGTIGQGSGTGSGFGSGSGSGSGRGRKSVVPEPKIGRPSIAGDLDKAIIRRYIRRKLPSIKYCYEKQLLVDKGLSGTVNTNFQISPQGSVLSSTASGVSGSVSSCVAGVIKTIKFPKPKGGGIVQVRYPFIFRKPAN